MNNEGKLKKAISLEGIIFIIIFTVLFSAISWKMGLTNMFNTIMNSAHDLLLNTVFFIMGIAVVAGAMSALFSEFGVIAILNKILSPLMKPLYNMPGAAALGIITTYLSDNPAVLTLAEDEGFKRYFKKFQVPLLTNLGTAFGMGLIVTTFMMSQKSADGTSFFKAAIIGNIGAIIGSIISVRIMMYFTKKEFGTEDWALERDSKGKNLLDYRVVRDGSLGTRILESLLEGGKSGVQMGVSIIPGVLIICTLVLMLTNGPGPEGIYTGKAYEGIGLLPWIGGKLSFIIEPLLGFKNPQAIAFPITSLGSTGAAIGLVPDFLNRGIIGGNEIAVFTAMGMCWSGYLSTHVAMMDVLKVRKLTGKAILSHAIGGLSAGIAAHYIYILF
ncbi:CD0519/CD1768 family membrane protein [Clostridium fallax]|uniref:Nucleoside recognition n=1 Tax=Clostridium fallax TaxID=1533 RepID=A0A1M4WQN0_9CLOT|nr:hypothetical protein [Clostridium fallax]SHE83524.1 hypothetical protein SAMN05443638_11360 [Clostridium fallax]SQB06277.1 Uncharacterized protein conserved in bacteria [Clostridium fallax]